MAIREKHAYERGYNHGWDYANYAAAYGPDPRAMEVPAEYKDSYLAQYYHNGFLEGRNDFETEFSDNVENDCFA